MSSGLSHLLFGMGLGPLTITLLITGILFGLNANIYIRDPVYDQYKSYIPTDHYSGFIQSCAAAAVFGILGFLFAMAVSLTSTLYSKNIIGYVTLGGTLLLTVCAILSEGFIYYFGVKMANPLNDELYTNNSRVKKYINSSLKELYEEAMAQFQKDGVEGADNMLTYQQVMCLIGTTNVRASKMPDFEYGHHFEMSDLWSTIPNNNFTVLSIDKDYENIVAQFRSRKRYVASLNFQKSKVGKFRHEVCWATENEKSYKCKKYKDSEEIETSTQLYMQYLNVTAYFVSKNIHEENESELYIIRNFPLGYQITTDDEHGRDNYYEKFSKHYGHLSANNLLKQTERAEKHYYKKFKIVKFCNMIPHTEKDMEDCYGNDIAKYELAENVEGVAPQKNIGKYPHKFQKMSQNFFTDFSRQYYDLFSNYAFGAFIIQIASIIFIVIGKLLDSDERPSEHQDNPEQSPPRFQAWPNQEQSNPPEDTQTTNPNT